MNERPALESASTDSGRMANGRLPWDLWTIFFCVLVCAFVAFKVGVLNLPLYWDEAWSYAPAVKFMYTSGMSLHPGSMDPQITRGHPLLFHFLASGWMHVFGDRIVSMHAFALSVSILFLMAVFMLARSVSTGQVAIGAVVLILLNETFLAQSGLLLPEVMLALFVTLTAIAYVRRSRVGYVIAGLAAFMTKESGLVFIMAIFLWECIRLLATRTGRSGVLLRLIWIIAPFVIGSLFFVVQYVQQGWFFFPEHMGLMSFEPIDVIYKLKLGYSDLFERQGQPMLAYGLAFAAPVLWRGWNRRRSILVLLLFTIAIKVLYGRWPLPDPLKLLVPGLCLAGAFFLFLLPFFNQHERAGRFACLAFIFVWSYLLFCGLNFFADRYVLCALPFIAIGVLALLNVVLDAYSKWSHAAFMAMTAIVMLVKIGAHNRIGDCELSYADMIKARQQLVAFCEGEELYSEAICGGFMDMIYMSDPDAGYLSGTRIFEQVKDTITLETRYALMTNEPGQQMRTERIHREFELVRRFEVGKAWCEIYHRAH